MTYHDWHRMYLGHGLVVVPVVLADDPSHVLWTLSACSTARIKDALSETDVACVTDESTNRLQLMVSLTRNHNIEQWLTQLERDCQRFFGLPLPDAVKDWIQERHEMAAYLTPLKDEQPDRQCRVMPMLH